ncbi:hypothetical protein DPMN_141977 [Dreissena polymorpha]|uniref:Uncharacterized protein n=1 Tax=Dreissena polymorpha TaxID=45954 RepID=A0A9D4JI76_DREPO|nr:hypothetical protein DPMN_141977 [Dreissena polymorpha]
MDEASENDIDSEHSDSAGDEDFSWGNDELVNFTYTGSDWDYNCRDKQYCYEIDNECTDDEDYYNGKELDVVHDSDDDGSINGYCADQEYDDDPDSDYDNYSNGGLSNSYCSAECAYYMSLAEYYFLFGDSSNTSSDPDDNPIRYGYDYDHEYDRLYGD